MEYLYGNLYHCIIIGFNLYEICSIQFDRKDIEMNKMVVTTLDGKFYVYDLRTFHPQKGFTHLLHKV